MHSFLLIAIGFETRGLWDNFPHFDCVAKVEDVGGAD
jgi:hypothetical protein